MDDSESTNQGSYIQNIVENLKNKVFSPKAVVGLNSNMAAPPLDERNLEVVKLHAFVIAKDIVHYVSEFEVPEPANEHVKTMRRTVDDLRIKYEITFRGMFNKLLKSFPENEESEETSRAAIKDIFYGIGNEMLSDHRKNWGRIASLYAFGGEMARRLVEGGFEDLVDHCALVIGEYICTVLAKWIHENGGWDAFDEYFVNRDQQFEKRILQGLALVGGFGAALAVARIAVR